MMAENHHWRGFLHPLAHQFFKAIKQYFQISVSLSVFLALSLSLSLLFFLFCFHGDNSFLSESGFVQLVSNRVQVQGPVKTGHRA